jgi:DNA-binding transcriptional LysR family regulator
VRLLDRSTHHIVLTPAGAAFLTEARQVLASAQRAVAVAQQAGNPAPALQVGIVDAGYILVADRPPVLRRETDRAVLRWIQPVTSNTSLIGGAVPAIMDMPASCTFAPGRGP